MSSPAPKLFSHCFAHNSYATHAKYFDGDRSNRFRALEFRPGLIRRRGVRPGRPETVRRKFRLVCRLLEITDRGIRYTVINIGGAVARTERPTYRFSPSVASSTRAISAGLFFETDFQRNPKLRARRDGFSGRLRGRGSVLTPPRSPVLDFF